MSFDTVPFARQRPKKPVISPGGRQLLEHLFRHGVRTHSAQTQAALSRTLAISQPSVARLLQGFAQEGMLTLSERAPEGRGNPSMNVNLQPDYAYAFGVSLMSDAVAMVLIDLTGRVRGSRRMASTSMARGLVLARLKRFRNELLDESHIDPSKVIGAGVALSAFFTGEGGQMAGPPALEDWTRVELEPILSEALNLPVMLENDGAAAAVAESLYGLGQDYRDFVYLHLTNGFGGGIISDGRLFRGYRGNAGEFGGIWTISGLGYPNLDVLLDYVRSAGQDFETVEHMLGSITPDTPGVEAWLQMAKNPFEQLCGVLAYALDPQAIIIGGRLPSPIRQQLVMRLRIPRAPNRHSLAPPLPSVRTGRAPGDVVTLGAAVLPLQQTFFK